ncbi:DNA primase [Dendrosporobacter sp. 1207_IL3150]|uniref:DNA primase n=1 Tax=Dendrosporobacter sp. 1207_IL3150 TaxID=3084054 RepID=UPI002FD8D0DB
MKDMAYDEFIERLRSQSDIISVISDYVPLKKKGKNYWGCCPFHQEKSPSFSVNPEKGFFYCFGCQTGGNVFNFIMKVENIVFIEAAKVLARRMNIPLPQKEKSPQEIANEKELAKIWRANELARDFFHACLTKTRYGKAAKEYLERRGVTDKVIDDFKIGFAPNAWDKLVTAFTERGIERDILLKSGLAVERTSSAGILDRFRNRIIFPICDMRGRVTGFGGRVIDNSQPKYLNTSETPVFNKRNILFGFDSAHKFIRESGKAVVVEGYMDVITARNFGVNNIVASLGTAFTAEQAKQLMRYTDEIVFAYDSDAAGKMATMRALTIVRGLGASVKIISIPDGKDPDDFIIKHGAEAFNKLIDEATPLLEYQIRQALQGTDYSNLEGKVAVVAKVVPALAAATNAVEANAHIAQVSQSIGIDESAIRSEISKYLDLSQKDKNVNKGKTIRMVALSKNIDSAVIQAQRHVIRLIWEDDTIIPYIQAQLSIEEIQGDLYREIIKSLFEAYNMGKKAHDVSSAMTLNEAANTELSHILLIDLQHDDIPKLVDDCIKTIRIAHLKELYEQHRLRADELQRMGDSRFLQELAESQRIKHEISKLHYS